MHADALDLILVVLIVLSAFSGYRQGFVVGVLSFIGLLGGAVIGAQIAPLIAKHFSGTVAPFAGVAIVFAFASLGRIGAGALGAIVRRRLKWQPARTVDSVGGAIVSGLAVLLIAWFIGSSLVQAPFPSVARQVNGSRVLAAVDHQVPSRVRGWFADFRAVVADGGFPQVFGALGAERIIPVSPPDLAVIGQPGVVAARAQHREDHRRCEVVLAPHRGQRVRLRRRSGHDERACRCRRAQSAGAGRGRGSAVGGDRRVLRPEGRRGDPGGEGPARPAVGVQRTSRTVDKRRRCRASLKMGPTRQWLHASVVSELARGPDIYQDADVTRDIYAVRAQVEPGNSGGPLLDTSGGVAGVVFGRAVNDASTGYALTASQVSAAAAAGRTATAPVSTRGCD